MEKSSKSIKVGSLVTWSGCWGKDINRQAEVESILKGSFNHDTDGKEVKEVAFNERAFCVFILTNGHWCYGDQISDVTDKEIEVRITFRGDLYIKGNSIQDIRDKWEELSIFSADALENYSADFVELVSSKRVDDGSYDDIKL